MILYIEIVVSYIISYDIAALNIMTRYNRLGITLASKKMNIYILFA
jgi:hypothetical protein